MNAHLVGVGGCLEVHHSRLPLFIRRFWTYHQMLQRRACLRDFFENDEKFQVAPNCGDHSEGRFRFVEFENPPMKLPIDSSM